MSDEARGETATLRRFWRLLYEPEGSIALRAAGEALPPTLEGICRLAEEATAAPEAVKEFLEVSLPGGFVLQGSVVSQELMGGRPWLGLTLVDLGDESGALDAGSPRLQVGLSLVSAGAEWHPMEAYYAWFRDVLRRFRLELLERQANALQEAAARLEYGNPGGVPQPEVGILRARCRELVAQAEEELRLGQVLPEVALSFLERAEDVQTQCWEILRSWNAGP